MPRPNDHAVITGLLKSALKDVDNSMNASNLNIKNFAEFSRIIIITDLFYDED